MSLLRCAAKLQHSLNRGQILATGARSFAISNSSSTFSRMPVVAFSTDAPKPKLNMALIKILREKSSAPISECKDSIAKATEQLSAGGATPTDDQIIEAAVELLRKKGISTAAKKSSRLAKQGVLTTRLQWSANSDLEAITIAEANSETDFVSSNEAFHRLGCSAADGIHRQFLTEAVKADKQLLAERSTFVGTEVVNPTTSSFNVIYRHALGTSPANDKVGLDTALTQSVVSLRENMRLRRSVSASTDLLNKTTPNSFNTLGYYVYRPINPLTHSYAKEGDAPAEPTKNASSEPIDPTLIEATKAKPAFLIGTQVAYTALSTNVSLSSPTDSVFARSVQALQRAVLFRVANKISMHAVAMSPLYLDRTQIPAENLAKEKEIAMEQLRANKTLEGKKPQQIEKIIEGKISKYFSEVCLLNQTLCFPVDVRTLIAESAVALGYAQNVESVTSLGPDSAPAAELTVSQLLEELSQSGKKSKSPQTPATPTPATLKFPQDAATFLTPFMTNPASLFANTSVKLSAFSRLAVGEGIKVEESKDFAKEVMEKIEQAKQSS